MIFVFGIIGFLFGGIPGLFIGLLIGYLFSDFHITETSSSRFYTDSILLKTLPILSAWLSISMNFPKTFVWNVKSLAMKMFGMERAKYFMEEYKHYTDIGVSYEKLRTACNEINYSFAPNEKIYLIQIYYRLIVSRDDFDSRDLQFLNEIANLFQISVDRNEKRQESSNRPTYFHTEEQDPYQILGLNKTATNEEIKKQYRTLSKRYHPDLNANLSDSERLAAEVKMRELNDAYETLKKERYIK